jgi:N-acetylglutamate synthase-like GNAT family acetyltransferase
VSIRAAGEGDVAAIAALVREAYAAYVPLIGREPAPVTADHGSLVAAGEAWVAEREGEVVGVLVLRPEGRALLLENVAVSPAWQGRGIGRALIAFAEQHGRELGLAEVTLYTNEQMRDNLLLYPRLGFEETGRRTEDGYARVYFRKPLR